MHAQYRDLYCKLFIDVNLERAALTEVVAQCLGGRVSRFTVESPICEADVRKNDDFDADRTGGVDGFLYYPFFLDIEPRKEAHEGEYIAIIGHLLECLWSKDMKAVAAADFENELPQRGGYNAEGLSDVPPS